MRYFVLATDYDGTLAHDGVVDATTYAALERVKASGRKLILVTGRQLSDLEKVFPQFAIFDRIVAENGAVLYTPASKEVRMLAEPPPPAFVEQLRQNGVDRIEVGHVIVATWVPHEVEVLRAISHLGLEMQVIFNKGAVMVLPSGVNKATGLYAALDELGISPHNCVAVGDAENDHALLRASECGVAVANALPALKERADLTTQADHGAGVTELIDDLLQDDLAVLAPRLRSGHILAGKDQESQAVSLNVYGETVLLVGPSGSGKTTFTTSLLEGLVDAGYQFCVLDPEGDYSTFSQATALGDPTQGPNIDEVLDLVDRAHENVVVNLVGVRLADRPQVLQRLMPQLQTLRSRHGRPHWIVIDEAHHLLPTSWDPARLQLSQDLGGMLFITLEPENLSSSARQAITTLVVVGEKPHETLQAFCQAANRPTPEIAGPLPEAGQVLFWRLSDSAGPRAITGLPPSQQRRRHSRKYAEGELPEDRSFYFRGPQRKLNLRAQNLLVFLQIAEGVDDETWLYHLHRGDYSDWFRHQIKDDELAELAAHVESRRKLSARRSRDRIRRLVEERYTAPG